MPLASDCVQFVTLHSCQRQDEKNFNVTIIYWRGLLRFNHYDLPTASPPLARRDNNWQIADNNDDDKWEAESQEPSSSPPWKQKKEEVLLDIRFARDVDDKFDPKNPSSLFEYSDVDLKSGMQTDNAAFLPRKHTNLVDMVSLPFAHWLPQNMTADAEDEMHGIIQYKTQATSAAKALFDGSAKSKDAFPVAPDQVLKVAYKFTCQTLNTEKVAKRFPHEAILNYEDDPRLATCAIALTDYFHSGVELAIHATSHGVWAKYSVNVFVREFSNGTYDAFDIYRRIGSRASVDELIDIRMEVDRGHRKEARYYLDDKLVWSVGDLGILSDSLFTGQNQRNRLVSYSPGPQPLHIPADPEMFVVFVANIHKMDEADPNRHDVGKKQYSPGLIRLSLLPHLYGNDIWYYDEKSQRYNSLAGQGAIMGMKTLSVSRCSAQQQQQHINNNNEDAEAWQEPQPGGSSVFE